MLGARPAHPTGAGNARMKLIAYKIADYEMPIRPAPATRAWMDGSPNRYTYRCLPLVMANQFGWEILTPQGIEARYNGGVTSEDIDMDDDAPPWLHSHFGMGIITISTPYLFRTPPGIELLVTGPVNYSVAGIAPLEGIVETSWSPYSFTINWQFTHPGFAGFCEGDPLCRILPIPSPEYLEGFEAEVLEYDKMPAKDQYAHDAWSQARGEFIANLIQGDPQTVKQGWQKDYVKGAQQRSLKLRQFE